MFSEHLKIIFITDFNFFTFSLKYAFWVLHLQTQKQLAIPPIGGKQFYLLPDSVGSAVKSQKKKKAKEKRFLLLGDVIAAFSEKGAHCVSEVERGRGRGGLRKNKGKKIGCKVCRIMVRDRRETWASRGTAAAASLSLLQPRKTHRICLQPLDKILQPSVSIHSILIDTTTCTYMLHTHRKISSHR